MIQTFVCVAAYEHLFDSRPLPMTQTSVRAVALSGDTNKCSGLSGTVNICSGMGRGQTYVRG